MQIEWLKASAYKDGRKLLRDKTAYEAMEAFFGSVLRWDTLTPMSKRRPQHGSPRK